MQETSIAGLFKLPYATYGDERGQFTKFYSEDMFSALEIDFKIRQINLSKTAQVGTVRGMHFQVPPYSEVKVIRCIKGKIFDVIVDVRQDSKTFLKHQEFELGETCGFALCVPAGCAHGFQVLESPAEILYAHSQEYRPEFESGLQPLDPKLAINWPLDVALLSERDELFPFIDETFKGHVV